jgi:hypothetical protein
VVLGLTRLAAKAEYEVAIGRVARQLAIVYVRTSTYTSILSLTLPHHSAYLQLLCRMIS